jgi:protein TonB
MRRLSAALALSVALHLLLLSVLPGPEAKPERETIRVSLHALPKAEAAPTKSLASERPLPAKNEQRRDVRQPQNKTEKSPKKPAPQKVRNPVRPVEPTPKPSSEIQPPQDAAVTGAGEIEPTATPSGEGVLMGEFAAGPPAVAGSGGAGEGGGAIIDVSSLTVTKKITPEYPMISRKRKDHGTVTLLVTIRSGQVASIEVERSSGYISLDESAVRAVRQWEFDVSGYGETVVARIPFAFTLQ